jgi:hypothetical protein
MRRALAVGLLVAGCAAPAPSTPSTPAPTATSTVDSSDAPIDSPPLAELAWEVLPDAPFARLEMAVAEHDGRIWLAGGLSPLGEALTDVAIFDPASGEWTDGPALPIPLHHAALVADGDRLVLIGGALGAQSNLASDFVFVLPDEATGWQEGPRLPAPRMAGAAAFDGERIVFAGGRDRAETPMADVFALTDEGWRRIGEMANARHHLAATTDRAGTVWLLGGRALGLTDNMADVEVVTSRRIERVGAVPTPRGGVAAFFAEAYGGCLTGGEAPEQAYAVVECVAADGTVTTLPALNEPHHGHGAAVVDGVVYVLLGGPQQRLSADSTVEALRLQP